MLGARVDAHDSPLEDHQRRAEAFRLRADGLERRGNRISLLRLVTFVGAGALVAAGVSQESFLLIGAGVATLVAFFALVVWHARLHERSEDASTRRSVHLRHVKRMTGEWTALPGHGRGLLAAVHPYASDIDVVGEGSLFQRIDTTGTARGAEILASWLGTAAPRDEIGRRQAAVKELAADVAFREELEAAARAVTGDDRLDHSPFLAFAARPSFFARVRPLVPVIHLLPPAVLVLYVLGQVGLVPGATFGIALFVQIIVWWRTGRATKEAFDLIAARRGYVEAFKRALVTAESARHESPLLVELRKQLTIEGRPPSSYFRRLDRWAGFAELHHQFPLNIVANVFLLWDLHVLLRLERWNEEVGRNLGPAFDALGAIEALAALGGLAYTDPAATFPEVVDPSEPFVADGLAHPLLPPRSRVPNDVTLRGPGTALVVTGSNMAGKSTLLRSVGVNVVLALAGGPVTARRLRVPYVRLRASMRAEDSLQRGASYFHAELGKLRMVVDDAGGEPPILFLLDELLRGTNARARHVGARAVLRHLLDRRATGFVATHDVALSELEQEEPERVENVHFTDVMIDGEMTFDYTLRPGPVRTSNALRLLRMAGIEVPDEDSLPVAEVAPEATKDG
jgi:hypothetical protein